MAGVLAHVYELELRFLLGLHRRVEVLPLRDNRLLVVLQVFVQLLDKLFEMVLELLFILDALLDLLLFLGQHLAALLQHWDLLQDCVFVFQGLREQRCKAMVLLDFDVDSVYLLAVVPFQLMRAVSANSDILLEDYDVAIDLALLLFPLFYAVIDDLDMVHLLLQIIGWLCRRGII